MRSDFRLASSAPPSSSAVLLEKLKYLDEDGLKHSFIEHQVQGCDGHIDAKGVAGMLRDCSTREAGFTEEDAAQVIMGLSKLPLGNRDGSKLAYVDLKVAVDAASIKVDKRVVPISATLTLTFIAQATQFPVLPQLARSLELTAADLGFVSSSSALARLLCNVPASVIAERIGRRPLLVAGPLISSVGMAGLSVSTSFTHLACSNAFIGMGMATAMAGAGLYLSDISTPKNRARTNAPLFQSALIGFSIGPAIGGYLAESYGFQVPFIACSLGLVASSASAMALLPETMHEAAARRESVAHCRASAAAAAVAAPLSKENEGSREWTEALGLLRRPALQGLGSVVFMNGFSQGAMPVTIILYGIEVLGMSSSEIGGLLTATVLLMVGVSRPATRLSDSVANRKSIMVPALAATALLNGLQPLATGIWEFAALVGGASLGNAVSMPSISPLVLDATTDSERATALAMRQTAQDIGTLLGASTMGVVATQVDIATAIQTSAVLQGAAAAFFAFRVPSTSDDFKK